MEVKTLRFLDKQSAMKEIRIQYGLDAVILDNKMVKEKSGLFGLFSKKVCEITIAYEPSEPPVRLNPLPKGGGQKAPSKDAFDAWLPRELAPDDMDGKRVLQPTPPQMRNRPMPEDSYRFRQPRPGEPPPEPQAPQTPQTPQAQRPPAYEPAAQILTPPPSRAPAQPPSAAQVRENPQVQVMDSSALLEIRNKREKERAERVARIEQQNVMALTQEMEDIDVIDVIDVPEDLPAASATLAQQKPPEADAKATVKEQLRQFASNEMPFREPLPADKSPENLETRVDEIKDMLQRFTDRLEYAKYSIESGYSPEVEDLFTKLVANGVQTDIAHELCRQTQKTVDAIQAKPEKVMRKMLAELMGEPTCIKGERGVCKKVMLIGPTGVGKTTTLAKLAAQFAIKQHFNVGVINADIFRIAAQDQLNAYADIMNIPCITVFSTEEMVDALKQFVDKDIVLIDTTGKVASDEQYHEQIKSFVSACEVDQVFLTLCSTTAERVLKEIIKQHSFVKDYGLIVTKIDEDVSLGNFVNIAKYSGRPFGYYTIGQSVPDDIRTVDTDELIDKILR